MSTVTDTLKARGSTHGNFIDNSAASQSIKDVMRGAPNWGKLRSDQKEALDMVAHKIGRILAGDANFHDHWHDIEGYTNLVSRTLITPQKGRK